MPDSSRRLILRVGVKLMLLFSVASTLYVLLAGIDNQEVHTPDTAHQPLQRRLSQIPQTNPQRLIWSGGNLILIWRDEALLNSLHLHEAQLRDPYSRSDHQSHVPPSPARSLKPGIFIAFDRGTDMGCPLSWIPAGHNEAPRQPWPGGFRDNCRGSWYDAAGRVFRNQEASRNLDIPQYHYLDDDLLEVGRSGDNAAPVN